MTGFPPQIEADVRRRLAALGVKPDEIEERFVRGRGPGGQKINKTASTIWLRHHPTGTEVRSQPERSQTVNRQRAWELLCGKLEVRRAEAAAQARAERETERRRTRQKSHGQKVRMIEGKKHRAGIKSSRGRVGAD
jgi:protein subunit release factor B